MIDPKELLAIRGKLMSMNIAIIVHAAPAAADAIQRLESELKAAKKWIKEKGRHHIACMKLDAYDERDYECTCGYDAIKEKS